MAGGDRVALRSRGFQRRGGCTRGRRVGRRTAAGSIGQKDFAVGPFRMGYSATAIARSTQGMNRGVQHYPLQQGELDAVVRTRHWAIGLRRDARSHAAGCSATASEPQPMPFIPPGPIPTPSAQHAPSDVRPLPGRRVGRTPTDPSRTRSADRSRRCGVRRKGRRRSGMPL